MSLLLIDMDGVLVLRRTVDFDKHSIELTDELCRRLLHAPALGVVSMLVDEGARLTITSNWTRFMSQEGFMRLFAGAGFPRIGDALHSSWKAPVLAGRDRLAAVDAWLAHNHSGEPYCVVDDLDSGSGLAGSSHDLAGRVVLCRPNVGLHQGHLPRLRTALAAPAAPMSALQQ